MSTLVLGLGNVICGDDGAGVVALLMLLRQWALPPEVLAIDGGTLGLSLLPLLQDADRILLIDAILADGPPGTLVRLTGAEVPAAVATRLSPHQVGVADLLDALRLGGANDDALVLHGVVPESIELSMDRTPAVAAALPALAQRVSDELLGWGLPLLPRTLPFTPSRAHRVLGL